MEESEEEEVPEEHEEAVEAEVPEEHEEVVEDEEEEEDEEDEAEEAAGDSSSSGTAKLYQRGPSQLPKRPIPLERRPMVRPGGSK